MTKGEFNPRKEGLLSLIEDGGIIDKLIDIDDEGEQRTCEAFTICLDFKDRNEASQWSRSVEKFIQLEMWDKVKEMIRTARARAAVNASRSKLITQTFTYALVPEYFGGKGIKDGDRNGAKANY